MHDRPVLWRRVLASAREEGPRGLWWRSLSATVYRRLVVAFREIDSAPQPPGQPADAAIELGLLEHAGIEEYGRLRPDQAAAEVERRLAGRQQCALARLDGELVSARWFSAGFAEFDYLDLVFELAAGTAYVYDVYSAPAVRGRGVSAIARVWMEEELRRQGRRRLLGTFMPENTAGRGLVAGGGYRPLGTVGCFRLPGARIPVRRIEPGYLGPSRTLRRSR